MQSVELKITLKDWIYITIIGAFYKLTNQPKDWTTFFLIIGMTFEGVAVILLILKLFKKKNKTDSFLDS